MARSYAMVDTGIWDDPEFCALNPGPQRTYFMLFTQPDIAACGTLSLTLRRWSKTVANADIQVWITELETVRFVVVDEETEELLVRTFVKWDGGYKHPRRLQAILSTAKAIRSRKLRGVVAAELHKLEIEVPFEWDKSGTGEAFESPRVVVTKGEYDPQPALLVQQPPTHQNGKGGNPKHRHEPNAIRALTQLKTDRSLPITVEELLEHAYRLGSGDPWEGYLAVKVVTNFQLDSARNPVAALRARLESPRTQALEGA